QFFRQFGITVSAAVMLSLFVAFTLDPMLSSRFSKKLGGPDRFHWLKRPFLRVFEGMDAGYRRILGWAVGHKAWVAVFALASLALMAGIGKLMGSEFVTAEDRGQFVVDFEVPAGTSLDETDRLSSQAEKLLLANREIKLVYANVGLDGDTNKAEWRVVTTSKRERQVPLATLKDAARHAVLKA